MAWTEAQRRRRRAKYESEHSSHHGMNGKPVVVPDDVVVLDRDPAPCFRCEARDGCRHRPWMLAR